MIVSSDPPDRPHMVAWVEGPTWYWAEELPDMEAALRLAYHAGKWAAWSAEHPEWGDRAKDWAQLATVASCGLFVADYAHSRGPLVGRISSNH